MQQLLDPPIAPITKVIHEPDYFKIFSVDPRPDLVSTDIWTKLLKRISDPREIKTFFQLQALSCLINARRMGTTIAWDMNYGYKLKPVYDFGNWDSVEYWEECRQKYFKQYAEIWRNWFYLIDHD
jgi:hypothetical protein